MRHFNWPKVTRDTVLTISGLVIGMNEAFITHQDRTGVLAFAAGLIGSPFFLRKDEKKREGGSE